MRRRTVLKAGAVTCAVALLGSLAACGGDKEPTTTADGKPIVSVLVVKRPATDKIANMQWAKDLEVDCDCKIEWQEVSEDAWAQQKNATLAAGKIADVSLHAFFPADWATKTFDACDADQLSDGKTAKTGVSFGWSQDASFGTLKDQYIPIPVPSAPGVSPDKTVWDGSSVEFEADRFSLSSHAANKDAALKLANLLYSEKYSVQQFLGSFGNLVTDDGNRHYTVDEDKYTKAMGDNLFPGLADRFSGWIPDGVTIKGDVDGDNLLEASKPYEEQRSHFDPVKDYIPDYVNPDPTDSNTLTNNNAQISNVVMQKTATWMSKGGIDEEWDAYCKQLNSLGLQDNIKIWQKWYDIYTKK